MSSIAIAGGVCRATRQAAAGQVWAGRHTGGAS